MRKILTAFALAGALVLSGCGYNDFQTKDEQVKAAWSEVRQPVQAPRRPHPEPRERGAGLRRSRRRTCCWA